MAKKSSIEKNARRIKLAKQAAPRRARLKQIAIDRTAPPEDRFAALSSPEHLSLAHGLGVS